MTQLQGNRTPASDRLETCMPMTRQPNSYRRGVCGMIWSEWPEFNPSFARAPVCRAPESL